MTGQFFDGSSSRSVPAQLEWVGSALLLLAEGRQWSYQADEVSVSEPVNWAPRVLSFADGGRCELPETAELRALLQHLQVKDGWVVRAQRHLGMVLLCSLLLCVSTVAAYFYGLPLLARWGAQWTPTELVASIDQQGLQSLDKTFLQDSAVETVRRVRIQQLLNDLLDAQAQQRERVTAQLHFRSSPALGPNALALPGGSIVVLDELLTLADDAEVQAVLAHELGHVVHRHGLRLAYQNAASAALAAFVLGDVSAIIAVLPGLVLNAHYARELEREADRYAVNLLIALQADPWALKRVLQTLHQDRGLSERQETGFLDSHPAPRERFIELEQMIREARAAQPGADTATGQNP